MANIRYYLYEKYSTKQGDKYSELKITRPTPAVEGFVLTGEEVVATKLGVVDGQGITMVVTKKVNELAVGEVFFRVSGTTKASRYILDNKTGSYTGRVWINSEYVDITGRGVVKDKFVEYVTGKEKEFPSDGALGGFWYVAKEFVNHAPDVTLTTGDKQKIYENGTVNVAGTVLDPESGDAMVVKYKINNGTTRALAALISKGQPIPFTKLLTFKNKRLYDGDTAITPDLDNSAVHTLSVWAEDDLGGVSDVVSRTFEVFGNRAPIVILNPLASKTGQTESDSINLSGSASDPDGNSFTVSYRVGAGSFAEIAVGAGNSFYIPIKLSALNKGDNTVTVRATDSYGASTDKSMVVKKEDNSKRLKESVKRYKITPPNKKAKGVILWIEREVGDLLVSVDISMTANGVDESYQPMTFNSTSYVSSSREQDEFEFESDLEKENIIVKITMARENASSEKSIRLVSGVLS